MRPLLSGILLLLLLLVSVELFHLYGRYHDAVTKLASLNAELQSIQAENEKLKGDIVYYSDPDNLEKELRARFNYKKPGEQLIIVVPKR